MDQRDRRRYDMLTRVSAFGAAHTDLFPPGSPAHDAFAVVAAAIDQLQDTSVAARTAAYAARAEHVVSARRALVDTLLRARLTADVIEGEDADVRRLASFLLRIPAEDGPLLTTARVFVTMAGRVATRFAAHGLPLDQLTARIADLEQALAAHDNARSGQTMARAQTQAVFRRAMRAVAAVDVSIANHYASDAAIQTAWQHARRLGYVHRSPDRGKKKTALAARPPVAALPPASGIVAVLRFYLSKLRRRDALPPPDVEVNVIEPARKPTRLLGP